MKVSIQILALACCIVMLAASCQRKPQFESGPTVPNAETDPGGAVSSPSAVPEPPTPPSGPPQIDWAPLDMQDGTVAVSCELHYREERDDRPLSDFSQDAVRVALERCADHGVARIIYRGRIDSAFASMIERVTVTADALGIEKRLIDIDSPGGRIEDAIRAGDFIAESQWSIWVREGSICHSACVFILAAGDIRMIAGQVGIHRIIRMSSTATSRAELNEELQAVYRRVRAYFERNGAASAVVDLMTAVPNRSLRLLSSDELQLYGLSGVNPAQDDLDRLRLMRKCGEQFVARRDSFIRAFERQCRKPESDLSQINDCGLGLRERFGFPDSRCPDESPFSEFDLVHDQASPDPETSPSGVEQDPPSTDEPHRASADEPTPTSASGADAAT
jgi:ATP-dependent protease ClpP protease subunit